LRRLKRSASARGLERQCGEGSGEGMESFDVEAEEVGEIVGGDCLGVRGDGFAEPERGASVQVWVGGAGEDRWSSEGSGTLEGQDSAGKP
jgi:hypothetical protein